MAHSNLFLFNLPNNFSSETTIEQKKRKREENLKNWKWEDVIVIDDNDVPNDLVETVNNAEVKEEHVVLPNQHDVVDDEVPLAPMKRSKYQHIKISSRKRLCRSLSFSKEGILDIMAHSNLFLFNLPNNFSSETTIEQKKRKREENLKNWKWEDVIVIDDNDVPNDLVETVNNAEVKEEHVVLPNQHDVVDDEVPLAPMKRSKYQHIKISSRKRLCRVLPQSPLISRSNGNRGLTLSTAIPTRCISQFPQSNQTSSTTNFGPLTDITNVSGSFRRRGRPRLCDRVVSLDNTVVTQPLQLSPQHVLPQSPLNSRFNGNHTLTPSTTIPSRTTSSPLELSVVANTHDTSPPVRRPRGRPPLHPNVVPARRNVRPRLARNDDHINMSTNPTPRVMLSSVTVVDTDGNPVHYTQLPTENNPSCPTTNVVHNLCNSNTTNDMSTSATTQQNDTNVPMSVQRMARQNRRMREYCDSGDATYTCSHCQAKYWYAVLDHDLDWYKRNQNTIRSELYHGLHDRIGSGETNTQALGRIETFPYISEDITHKHRRLLNNQQVVFTDREIQNYTLLELETILNGNNRSLLDFPQLPQIDYSLMNIGRNRLIAAERMYNMNEELARFTTFYPRTTMSNRYQYVGDLRPNVTKKWTINVMIARAWTTYNPTTNRILSLDLILLDERRSSIHAKIPFKLINKYKDRVKEGCVYKIHNFTVLYYEKIIYRPLDRNFFVEFCYTTTTDPLGIQPDLFDRYVFAFLPFGSLTNRYGNQIYLTGGNITMFIFCYNSFPDAMALMYEDSLINSMKDTNIVVVLTCCKVGPYGGAPQLTTTVSTQFHINLPIVEVVAYANRPIHPVIFTSPYLKTEELKVTPMPEIYKRLTHGVDVGTRFIVYGMVIGIDMDHDWKYIQCNKCFKKAKEEGNQYKLVITIQDDNEEMNCVLFNTDAILLLGHTVDELITKSIKEGAGDPDWIVDYFIDSLIAKWVVLGIKIDSYNLAPTYVRRYTVTKYYGEDLNALNKHFGSSSTSTMRMVYSDVNIPSSLNDFDMNDYVIDDNNMGSTTTDYEEKIMDELMWGQVCETKDSLQVEVQDVVARDIGVNTIVSSSFSAEDDIQTEIDTSDDVGVEDTNVEDNQVDETGVGEAVVSEPQPNDIDVDDA
ncbi:replication factor A protein 1 [Artemisia annua]|uniref:Replication factor A protein 1 n=1 Tax=Artemisia annua TaxID=35608 RepID=A0A2U1M8I3_ARTAN|nr:replication factor A protein 1 [Artemisia annua]